MTGTTGRVSITVLISAAVMIAGCGGAQTGDAGSASGSDGPETTASGETASRKNKEAQPGAGETAAKDSREDARKAAGQSSGKGQPRRVALNLGGDPGTAFSGVCVVGGERTDFAAKTPQRYVFRAQRPGLECRIIKKGADDSSLRAVLLARGERHAQRTSSERSVIAFSLSKRGFSSEVRSSSGIASGGESSSSVRMRSDQDSSVVTRRIEGEKDVAR